MSDDATGDSRATATRLSAGREPAIGEAIAVRLDEAECLRLIAPGGIGRIVYSGRFGPTVLPVAMALAVGHRRRDERAR